MYNGSWRFRKQAVQVNCEDLMAESHKNNEAEGADEQSERKRERPSDRMFRRSQAAERRRRRSERADANFMRYVFGIAGVTTMIVFMIVYVLSTGMK